MSEIKKIFIIFILLFALSSWVFSEEEFVYDAKGERDPFMPLITPEGSLIKAKRQQVSSGKLNLEGIIYDKTAFSYALVNGEAVRVGDFVGDYQVVRIEEKKVIFIKDGKITEVSLNNEEE